MRTSLPVPNHFVPARASEWGYTPDVPALFAHAAGWRRRHDVPSSDGDWCRTHLLIIDAQNDFCIPPVLDQSGRVQTGGGALYVGGRSGTGAMDDNVRLAEFIYRNLGAITDITATFDTHLAFQIFSPSFWVDDTGAGVTPFRTITVDQIRRGEVAPNPAMAAWLCNGHYAWLRTQVEFYCQRLEAAGKYTLYIWPFHCLLGSPGHALAGVIQEARLFHAFARNTQSRSETKGSNPLTEHYSILGAEVLDRVDGRPLDHKNTHFIETLLASDMVIIAGQADSHCVKSTIDDLLGEIVAQDPALARKVYILTDCMSAVTVPDGNGGFLADFTPEAEAAHARFAQAGMHLVTSTQPIESWPGAPAFGA